MGSCPFIALHRVALEQRAKLMASLICKAKSVTSPDQGIKCTLWPEWGSQTVSYMSSGSHHVACQGREANSQTQLLLIIVPNSNYLVSLTRESILLQSPFYFLTWVGNQASSPIQPAVLSQMCTPPNPSSEFKQLPHPKIDHSSTFHLSKDITNRHTEKPRPSWLVKNCFCQSKPIKCERGVRLLILHKYQHKESMITKI